MLNIVRLRKTREEKGFTQSSFARRVGVSPSFYHSLEKGTKGASMDTLAAIVQALEVNLEDIWDTANEDDLPPVIPLRSPDIVMEKTVVRYSLPPTEETYKMIAEQMTGNEIEPELQMLINYWLKASGKQKKQILDFMKKNLKESKF